MRTREFEVKLEQQEGVRTGRLVLQTEADNVTGCMIFDKRQNWFRGRLLRKNHYIVSLKLETGAVTEDCDALLLAREDGALTGVLLSPWRVWKLSGQEAAEPSALPV